jgi:hypothetical protein
MKKFLHESTRRGRAEASLNVGSSFPKRSPPFTDVLFNHYSTNVADGDLSA